MEMDRSSASRLVLRTVADLRHGSARRLDTMQNAGPSAAMPLDMQLRALVTYVGR